MNIQHYLPLWRYAATFIIPPKYVWNLCVGLYYLLAATLGLYRPNGDGYVLSFWRSVDCMCNAIAFGDPKETISSRSAKARAAGRVWGCVLCRFLGWVATKIDGKPTDHCALSLAANVGTNAIIPDGD